MVHILHPRGLYTWYACTRASPSLHTWTCVGVSANSEDGTRAVRRQNAAPRARRERTARKFVKPFSLNVCSRRSLQLSRNRRSTKGDVFVHPNCFCLTALNFSSASRIRWFTRLSSSVFSNCIRVSFLKSSRNALSSESCLSTKRYKR